MENYQTDEHTIISMGSETPGRTRRRLMVVISLFRVASFFPLFPATVTQSFPPSSLSRSIWSIPLGSGLSRLLRVSPFFESLSPSLLVRVLEELLRSVIREGGKEGGGREGRRK